MVTNRTGGPRTGRPKKDGAVPFLQNPKRTYVMLMRATLGLMPQQSIRAASKIIAAHAFGNEVWPESLPPEGREIVAKCPPGMLTQMYGPIGDKADGTYKNTMRGARSATIEGASEIIRKLDRQAIREARTDPGVARWLRCAVGGLISAIQGGQDAMVASIFRNSGDPELEASWPGLVSFLNKPEQTKKM